MVATSVTDIALNTFTIAASKVLKFSRTEEANRSNDSSLKKLFNNNNNKFGRWNWNSDYSRNVISDASTSYNAQMTSVKDHLTPNEFLSTYLPERTVNENRDVWLGYAKLADYYSSPLGLTKQVLNAKTLNSKIGTAFKNEENGKGFANLFRKDYNSKDLKRLFVLLERLTLKKRRGGSIGWADIPEDLQHYFPALGNKRQSILLAIQNFVSAEKIQEEYCESTIGGDEYTPEKIAEMFQGEVEVLLDVVDTFLKDRKIDGTNGRAALRKVGIVHNMNDFLVVVEALYEGIQISLDQYIKKKLYRGVAAGVLPETSNVTNQECPGNLLKNIGCRCQIEQHFQTKTSVLHILATGTFLDMDAGQAKPNSHHVQNPTASEFGVPLELDTSNPSHRIICEIKFGTDTCCTLGTFQHQFPASRDTSNGVDPHPKYVRPSSQYSCSICKNASQDDFSDGVKRLTLHRACRLIQLDTALMLFNSPYAPKVKDWLERQGAECLEDVYGYLKDRPPDSGMYQRKGRSRNTLGAQREGKATDVEHTKGRFDNIFYHLLNGTFFCAHTSNEVFKEVRVDADDFCYGFMVDFTYETKASRELGTAPGSKKKAATKKKKKKSTAPKKSAEKKRSRSESEQEAELVDCPPKKQTRAERYAARGKKNVESDEERKVAAATETKEENSATALTIQPSGPTIEDTSKFTQQETADVEMKPADVEPSSSNEVSTCHLLVQDQTIVATTELSWTIASAIASHQQGAFSVLPLGESTESDGTQSKLIPISNTDDRFDSNMATEQKHWDVDMTSTTPKYNVNRNIIVVNQEVNLGRGPVTRIQDSIVSRDLCSINVIRSSSGQDRAFIRMNKPHTVGEVSGHGVHINGKYLDTEVGVMKELHSGDIISLFGPTGFAYKVKL